MPLIKVKLTRTNGVVVEGLWRDVDLAADVLAWYVHWYPKMIDLSGQPLFEDSHWDVPKIWQTLSQGGENLVQIIESGGVPQGYVVVQRAPYIGIDGKACGYIPFIAAAPWNRRKGVSKADLRGVGTTLIAIAAMVTNGIHGTSALELASLPDAEPFYVKLGFQRTGHQSKDGLNEFRLEQSASLAVVRGILPKLSR